MKSIILASGSPRRIELLRKTGLKFKIVESGFKEYFDSKLTPHEQARKLSLEKAKVVYRKFSESIIIAADTLIVCGGRVLGKPKDDRDAKKMLEFLSGKTHLLITGLTIIDGNNVITKSEETKIYMKKISDQEINSYLKTKEPYDKAGAYAIQGTAKKFIEKIEGDFDNAVGLPIKTLLKELEKLGIKPLK